MSARLFSWLLVALVSLASAACGDDDGDADTGVPDGGLDGGADADADVDSGPPDPSPPAPLDTVEETVRRTIPELSAHAYVVRVEHDVPHVYAENRLDAWRVLGFVMAQDRFFQMELTSRLSQGTLSELLGDAALDADLESRMTGTRKLVDVYLDSANADEAAEMDAFAEGVNGYLSAVRNRTINPPRELMLAYIFFGLTSVNDLLVDWDRRDVAATGATVQYGTSSCAREHRRSLHRLPRPPAPHGGAHGRHHEPLRTRQRRAVGRRLGPRHRWRGQHAAHRPPTGAEHPHARGPSGARRPRSPRDAPRPHRRPLWS
jgi:hypothetical protein